MVTFFNRAEGRHDGNGGLDYYIAEVLSQQDYYAFGMQMPYRNVTQGSNIYRYGFNGKENDNDVKGEGNQQDYGMRIYDPRLGKFLSVDPLTKKYAFYTPYQFAGNMPIRYIDLDGLEPAEPGKKMGERATGSRKGDDGVTTWVWDGKSWVEASLNNVTIYSRNYRKRLAPIVSDLYENKRLSNAMEITKYLVQLLWDKSELKEKIMKKLPEVPQLPSVLDVVKKISDRYEKYLFGVTKAIVENRDNPVDLLAAGAGLLEPHISLAYDLIIKRIFLKESINDINLAVFELVDANWRDLGRFNHVIQNQPMLRGGEYINAITVTMEQFYDIMHYKFFVPDDYSFYPVSTTNLNYVSKEYFNGEKPAFNIYFNSIGDKGFLHISEVGIVPIR